MRFSICSYLLVASFWEVHANQFSLTQDQHSLPNEISFPSYEITRSKDLLSLAQDEICLYDEEDDFCNCCIPVCSCEPEEILFAHFEEVFTNLEFLYWTIEEGASDYALRMHHPAWGPSPAFAQGRYQNATYEWRPGFRLLAGWYNEPKYWEIMGQYTWLYDQGRNRSSKPSESDRFLNPTWRVISFPPFAWAKSNLSLHYHLGDLLIARVFDPNPHFRFRLLGGATTSFIEQRWKIRYCNSMNFQDVIKNRWRYFGGGIRLGIVVEWFWGNCFYLTGKTTLASLLGSYHNDSFQKTTYNPSGVNDTSIPVRDTKFEDHRFVFHSQFLLGPSWQRVFNCWHVELFAGYEFNIWLNTHEVFRSTQSSPSAFKETNMANGLLGLHGLTMRFTVGF